MGQGGKFAGAVVHHPHIHALRRFPGQDLQDTAPHEALVHDKILQENKLPGLLQLPQELFKFRLPGGKVRNVRPVIHRVTAAAVDIPGQCGGAWLLLFKILPHPFLLGDAVLRLANKLAQPVFQGPVADVALGIKIQQRTEHRHHRHDNEPGIFGRGVGGAVQQDAHHGHCEDHSAAQNVGQKLLEPVKYAEQQHDLHQQQQNDQAHAAENSMDDPFSPRFQQPQSHAFRLFFFHMCSLSALVHVSNS